MDSNVADEAGTPEPPPADPAKGTGFGVVAVVLGGLGCLLPLIPFDLADARLWISLPFALPGLVIGLVGRTGLRLRDELEVRFGERHVDPETGTVSVSITMFNKGPATASYTVRVEVTRVDICQDSASADDLAPGASYQGEIHSCDETTRLADFRVQVKEAIKGEL